MKPLPLPEKFFLEEPLYVTYEIDNTKLESITDIIFYNKTLDMFCPKCKSVSTFRGENRSSITSRNYYNSIASPGSLSTPTNSFIAYEYLLDIKYYLVTLSCSRDMTHKVIYNIIMENNKLIKIGQYPSQYDIKIDDIKKYKGVLEPQYLNELGKAISLACSGIGVGSFVYLRRIFEKLINEAHEIAKRNNEFNEEEYQGKRIDEKIQLLKVYLPSFLTENYRVYSILSKGIHQLSEDECLEHYELLKCCIELILDEKLEMAIKQKKKENANKSIPKIYENIKELNCYRSGTVTPNLIQQ